MWTVIAINLETGSEQTIASGITEDQAREQAANLLQSVLGTTSPMDYYAHRGASQ